MAQFPLVSNLVQQDWSSSISGSPNYVWKNNLKMVKQVLKEWGKSTFIPPTKERQSRLSDLADI
jgi:hypothetical protein